MVFSIKIIIIKYFYGVFGSFLGFEGNFCYFFFYLSWSIWLSVLGYGEMDGFYNKKWVY